MGLLRYLSLAPKIYYTNELINPDLQYYLDNFIALKSASTQKQYIKIITDFIEYLKGRGKEFRTANENDALAYSNYCLLQKGEKSRIAGAVETCTRATVLRKCIILKGFYSEIEIRNPFKTAVDRLRGAQVGEKRPTEAIDSPEKVLKLLDLPSNKTIEGIRDRAILALLFAGGLRISEVVNLHINNIIDDQDHICVILPKTKSKKRQEQILPMWASQIIRDLMCLRQQQGALEDARLIVLYKESGEKPITVRTASRYFKKYCKQAALPKTLSTHSGRATACTQLLKQNGDYKLAKEFMRHSSFKMVETYDKRLNARINAPGKKLSYK